MGIFLFSNCLAVSNFKDKLRTFRGYDVAELISPSEIALFDTACLNWPLVGKKQRQNKVLLVFSLPRKNEKKRRMFPIFNFLIFFCFDHREEKKIVWKMLIISSGYRSIAKITKFLFAELFFVFARVCHWQSHPF